MAGTEGGGAGIKYKGSSLSRLSRSFLPGVVRCAAACIDSQHGFSRDTRGDMLFLCTSCCLSPVGARVAAGAQQVLSPLHRTME